MRIPFIMLERGGRRPKAPLYATSGAAAADLTAFLDEPMTIPPGGRAAVPTGIAIELPQGACAFIMARSGLSLRHGIALANGVGLIDSDYRGELMVSLINNGDRDFVLEDGMRIAQLCVMKYARARFVPAESLGETERGEGGFGSTGVGEPHKDIKL